MQAGRGGVVCRRGRPSGPGGDALASPCGGPRRCDRCGPPTSRQRLTGWSGKMRGQVSSWTDCQWMSPASMPSAACRHSRLVSGRSLPCAGTAAPRRGGSARFRPFRAWAGTCTLPSRDATPRSGGKDLPAERRLLRGCERMTTCPCENFPQGGNRPRRRGGAGGEVRG